MSDVDSETGEQPEKDLSSSDVVTKYKAAAEISNKAIQAVIDAIKDGARILELAQLGDETINREVGNIFKQKKTDKGEKLEKGVAFPTCISVNNIVGHFSPPAEDTTTLKEGDVVKIDLGVHIDGFIATQAETLVVQAAGAAAPITGRAADAIQAARTAFEAAIRLMRPGKNISDVADKLQVIAEAYGVNLVEGVLSHKMKQLTIDGNKCVLNKPTPEHRVEEDTFEENEVWAIDIVVSTGEGKPKVKDDKETTVYKRDLVEKYKLKLKASRLVLSEISKRVALGMPFTTRALVDPDEEKNKDLQKVLRMGLKECLDHGLLHPYPVLYEKAGDIVAQIKGTVLLMPNGSDKVTLAPQQAVQSDKSVTDADVLALLQTSLKAKAKKKAKKAKGKAEPAEEVNGAAAKS